MEDMRSTFIKYLRVVLPIIVMLILIAVLGVLSPDYFAAFLSFMSENWSTILFISLLIAIVLGILITQSSRIMMARLRKKRDQIKEKSDVRKMRFGVYRG